MAASKISEQNVYVQRVVEVGYLTAGEIYEKFLTRDAIDCELVTDENGNPIPFDFRWPKGVSANQESWSVPEEIELAQAIHKAFIPARQANLAHLVDHGIWTWIALRQIDSYVVNRWCGKFDDIGRPNNRSACSFFLTGESMQKQTRCASRRLYVAADTSFRANGDYSALPYILENTDVFSSLFERKLGIDAELTVEFAQMIHDQKLKRSEYRKAIKLLGLILGTTCLEFLSRTDKKELIQEAIKESSSTIITE